MYWYNANDVTVRQQLRLQVAGTRRAPTAEAKAALQERRAALYRSIQKWYLLQNIYMPLAVESRDKAMPENHNDEKVVDAEDLPIMFPSSLPPDMQRASLHGCASKEVHL
jgi:hypothetical protein